MDRGHPFAFGIERHFIEARICREIAPTHVRRGLQQSHLQRIAKSFPPLDAGIVTQATGEQEKGILFHSRMGWPLKELSSGEEGAHRHAVLGECPGLVGTDHRRRSQGLDRREILHQGIASRHPLAGHGEGQGDRREEAFRDVGDEDADGEDKVFPEGPADHMAQEEEAEPHRHRDHGHDPGHPTDLQLQGAGVQRDFLRETGDFAELGGVAGGKHDGAA